jgi:uncharacterized protein DUF5658
MEPVTPRHVASVLSLVAVLGLVEARAASAQEALLSRATFPVAETAPFEAQPFAPTSTRPATLVSLYVSFATLQAFDVASTRMALRAGGGEANPLVAPIAGSPLALIAVKAGVAGAMIYASERLWKTNRKAAVLTMIGLNAAYGMAVAHNYGIAASQRR